jgi:putative transposase
VFAQLDKAKCPRLTKIWADNKYRNHELDRWLEKNRDHGELEIKSRPQGTVGFAPVPKRWVVERTFAWRGRYRRHSRDYECLAASNTSMLRVRSIHLMLRRFAPSGRVVPFHYRQAA